MLILSGSLIGMMQKHALSYDSPLYGRRTAQMRLAPLPFTDIYAVQKLPFEQAVEQYGADGIVLGCLGMAGYGEQLEEKYPVKVLDPAFIAVAYAEMCARLGLCHIPAQYRPFTNESNVELL